MPEIGSALDIAKLVDEMRRAGSTPTEQDWNLLASQISNVFAARREEVAILRVSADATALNFVLPIKLSPPTAGAVQRAPPKCVSVAARHLLHAPE